MDEAGKIIILRAYGVFSFLVFIYKPSLLCKFVSKPSNAGFFLEMMALILYPTEILKACLKSKRDTIENEV